MDETAKEVATSTTAVTPTGQRAASRPWAQPSGRVLKAATSTQKTNFELLRMDSMDFSQETPEEKKIRLGGLLKVVGAVIPAIAPFVPALQPVAAVIGALKK
jgi:hypothetical protein